MKSPNRALQARARRQRLCLSWSLCDSSITLLVKQVLLRAAAALLLSLAMGCAKKPYQVARDHFDLAERAYCTNSIREAEKALLAYLQTATQDERNGLAGVDYDMARAITHERLLLIYRALGDTNKAESHFQHSQESLERFRRRVGASPPSTNMTQEAFAALIEKGERNQDVKWKKQ